MGGGGGGFGAPGGGGGFFFGGGGGGGGGDGGGAAEDATGQAQVFVGLVEPPGLGKASPRPALSSSFLHHDAGTGQQAEQGFSKMGRDQA
ncbi:hypothetical protein B0A55_13538 [Friedmanniomyces simplex]|uniref:Uncharacterized protein n=1 Tax=Friedmanniomyces simplex TaxID=329884 RepID=A0A4U0VUG1_9PEZI|nr:hypothetical protein B0A55_13538 [Friedmanniomyces simplex]